MSAPDWLRRLTIAELERTCFEAMPTEIGADADATRSILSSGIEALRLNAQVFDFGRIDPQGVNQFDRELAGELWRKRLLRLPFPSTIFTFRSDAHRTTVLAIDGVDIGVGDKPEAGGVTAMIVFTHSQFRRCADAFVWFEMREGGTVRIGSSVITPCREETDESFNAFISSAVAIVLRFSLLLNTKGVPQRHEPAPTKLNAKRARNGKPPLDAVTYVDLSGVNFSGGSTGKGKEMPMHFRRGHIRHFDDGSLTWVRDTIVKADGELKKRERYQVRR